MMPIQAQQLAKPTVFVTGGTGYMGQKLIGELLRRGFPVQAVARPGSEAKLPPGCTAVRGNALDSGTYKDRVNGAHTFVHLVGVSHPNPWKEAEFRAVDLASTKAAVA